MPYDYKHILINSQLFYIGIIFYLCIMHLPMREMHHLGCTIYSVLL